MKSLLRDSDDIPRTKWAPKDPVAFSSTGEQSSILSVSTAQDQGNFQSALYSVMANTVNFSTPAPPPLIHFSPEGSSHYAPSQSSVQQLPSSSRVQGMSADSPVGQPFHDVFECTNHNKTSSIIQYFMHARIIQYHGNETGWA